MSYRGHQKSPYHSGSPKTVYPNDQGRYSTYSSPLPSANSPASLPGWGTPAVGYSPRGNRSRGSPYSPYSPRGNNFSNNSIRGNSPRGQNYSQNKHYTNSPRNNSNTPTHVTNNRFASPSDVFKTPQSPLNRSYSSPASFTSHASDGKRQLNQRFQNSRRGRNFTPRGSSSIEDYYHYSMVEDPWKFTPPVHISAKS